MKRKFNYSRIMSAVIIIAITLIVSLLYTTNPWTDRVWRGDSSMFIYFGKAMRAGKKIYTDIFDHKGPVIFVLNYLGTFLPGRVTGVYWIELVTLFSGIVGMYRIARLYLSRLNALGILTLYAVTLSRYLQHGNLTETYALPFWIYSLYLFIRYFYQKRQVTLIETVGVGASVMLVFLLRANLMLSWIPIIVTILFAYIKKKDWTAMRTTISGFTIGFVGVGAIASILLIATKIWDAFIFQAFTFNFTYLEHAGEQNVFFKFLAEMTKDYSLFMLIGFVVFFMMKREELWASLGILSAFIFTFYGATLSGRPYLHYLILVFPIIGVMASMMLKHFTFNQKWQQYTFWIVIFCLYFPQIQTFKQQVIAENRPLIMAIRQQDISENKHDRLAKEVGAYVQQVTGPEDRIYSLFEAGRIYLLSERLANTKFFSLPAVNFNEFPDLLNEFYAEFDANPPKVIVLKHGALAQTELPFTKYLLKRVEANYRLTFSNARYEVYEMK
ncbi:hypothetical protein NHG29_06560 [Aerococcaceae bacterium NML160702]|nr:hypothetical protein [Aerococcaceae bacterium NML160702]